MKHLSTPFNFLRFVLFLFLFSFAQHLLFTSSAYAAPHGNVGPAGVWPIENGRPMVTSGDPRFQFIVQDCPAGNEVYVQWAMKGISITNEHSQKKLSQNNNPIIVTPAGGLSVAKYNVPTTDYWWRFYCQRPELLPTPNPRESNLPWIEGPEFTVKAINKTDLHFDYQPTKPGLANDPRVKLIAIGCPLNSTVYFEWNIIKGLHRDYNFRSEARWEGDVAVVTRRQGFEPGEYGVMIECGGIRESDADDLSFKFFIDDKKITPTPLPSPPPPVCEEFQDGGCFKVNTAIGPIYTKPDLFILSLFRLLLGLTGGIGVLVIIYAGYLIITSNGKAEQLQKGRELLLSALIGFLFIVLSFVILEVLTVDILHLPGFEKTISNPCGTRPGPC